MVGIANRVRVFSATTGTSTVALGAAYGANYLSATDAALVNGREYVWLIEQGTDFELVRGNYTSSGGTAARTTVLVSKIGGTVGASKINLNGTSVVSVVHAAEEMLQASNNLSELADKAAARTTLGLGSAAVRADTDFPRTDTAQTLSATQKRQATQNIAPATRTITGADSITIADWGKTILFNSATSVTVTLDAVATLTDGFWCGFKNINKGVVTLDPNGSETIDGFLTVIVPKSDQGKIVCTGAVLHTVDRPSIVLLGSGTVSNAASLDVPLAEGFERQVLKFRNLSPRTNATDLWARVSADPAGSTYYTTNAYGYGAAFNSDAASSAGDVSSGGPANQIALGLSVDNTSVGGGMGEFVVISPDDFGQYHRFGFEFNFRSSGSAKDFYIRGGAVLFTSTPLTFLRLLMSSGNIDIKYVLEGHRRLGA